MRKINEFCNVVDSESDSMVQYLKKKKLSKEAKAVLNEGRELWKAYFSHTDV